MTSGFSERMRQYQDALTEALSEATTAVRDTDLLAQLDAIALHGLETVAGEQPASGALETLRDIASRPDLDTAISEAAALFESPQRFRDALFFTRCLDRDPATTRQLLQARLYLEGAAAPAAYPELASQQASLLEATTFALLWREPSGLDAMLKLMDAWRREYAPVYAARHADFSAAIGGVALEVERLAPLAHAVEQLNGLRRLGAPVALATLSQFHELAGLYACPLGAGDLADALERSPVCPQCSYRLGQEPPIAESGRVRLAIESALASQAAVLDKLVVSRLLERPSSLQQGRLDRFVKAVQAPDMPELTLLLDEGTVEFLRDLLDSPGPRLDIIDMLARDFPEVTTANAHDVGRRLPAPRRSGAGARGRPILHRPQGFVLVTDYLVLGQGNPGSEHAAQRHNLGFWVIDALARRHRIKLQGPRFWQKNLAEAGRGEIEGAGVLLIKPQTFYNGTGRAALSFMTRERVKPDHLIVIYDDLDLPEGRIRLRPNGSHGGNNGLKSIIEAIGSSDFGRIRVGVGRPWVDKLPSWDQEHVIKWLLSKPPPESRQVLDAAVERACDAIEAVIRDGWERAMDTYNRKE